MVLPYLLILFVIVFCSPARATDISVYMLVESFSHSEPTSIKALIGDWDDKLYHGELALSSDRAELGVGWEQWRLGYIQRYEYFFEFSADTALLRHRSENKQELTPGEQLDIYLSANTLAADGFRLSRQQKLRGIDVVVALAYLRGRRFYDGSLSGDAQLISEKDYDIEFDVDYYYSRDQLFDRVVDRPSGHGYALDVELNWQLNRNMDVKFAVNDLLAKMYWQDAPRTVARANSENKEFDEDGFVIFQPVISGVETNKNYTQTIPRKLLFATSYRAEPVSLELEYRDYAIKRFFALGVGYPMNQGEDAKVLYNITADALALQYTNRWFSFLVMTDNVALQQSRTFGLQLSATIKF